MASFLRSHSTFIQSILDLKRLVELWEDNFSNVVLLTIEQLRNDEEGFWGTYEQQLGVTRPTLMAREKAGSHRVDANESLGSRIAELATLNAHAAAVASAFRGLSEYRTHFPQEYKLISEELLPNRFWITRRIAEFADDTVLRSLTKSLDVPDEAQFRKLQIENTLADFLEEHFIDVLNDFAYIPDGIVAGYRKSVNEALPK